MVSKTQGLQLESLRETFDQSTLFMCKASSSSAVFEL